MQDKSKSLWSDDNPEDLMFSDGYHESELYVMIFNLYEDIRCLKEDINVLENKLGEV